MLQFLRIYLEGSSQKSVYLWIQAHVYSLNVQVRICKRIVNLKRSLACLLSEMCRSFWHTVDHLRCTQKKPEMMMRHLPTSKLNISKCFKDIEE